MTESVPRKKSLGQHWLADSRHCARVVRLADIAPGDRVVEIGAGSGLLTDQLLRAGAQVLAVEFDRDMVALLARRWPAHCELPLQVVQANALTLRWDRLTLQPPWKVVGNLPYNISTRLIRQMIEIKNRFHNATFLIQKEVAERLLAAPGSSEYGGFSVLIQSYFQVQRGWDVPPGAFSPPPRVRSHALRLLPRPDADPAERGRLEDLLRAAFRQRRKTLANNLKGWRRPERLREAFAACGADLGQRPQELAPEQFQRLAQVL